MQSAVKAKVYLVIIVQLVFSNVSEGELLYLLPEDHQQDHDHLPRAKDGPAFSGRADDREQDRGGAVVAGTGEREEQSRGAGRAQLHRLAAAPQEGKLGQHPALRTYS